MKFGRLILVLTMSGTFSGAALAQQWSGILSPSRAINWSSAGVTGGIPNRTTICSTLNPGATAAQINSAIAACPSGQVVLLNAGTYNLSAGIHWQGKGNVTLRGAGADQTFLIFSNTDSCHGAFSVVCIDGAETNWKGGPSNLVNWTSGYSRGATTITLASVPNLKVGSPIMLDQLDDTSDGGSIFVCASTPACSREGNGGGGQRPDRNQVQIVTVIGCGGFATAGALCSGSNVNVTISPGLYMPNWGASKSPQAWWATSPALNDGVEDLSMDSTNAGSSAAGVEIFNCLNCWAKGVRIIDTGRAHVQVQLSARITIRDTYQFLTQNSVSQSYGVECYTGSDLLVENNVFHAVASPLMINGACSGSVFSYNFSINNFYTASPGYSLASTNDHTAGTDFTLREGNVANQLYADNFHGTHHFATAFRNYYSGTQPVCYAGGGSYANATWGPCNNNLTPIVLEAYSRYYNIIGNVLGTAGVQSGSVYNSIGSGNGIPDDPISNLSLMRWGNYDTVNSASRFVATEVPSAITSFANPLPTNNNLPPSFYLSVKPSWWPATKPWPAIGPDVTGGTTPNAGGRVFPIPAQDCYTSIMRGPTNGTGGVLPFNASNCYSGSVSPPSTPAPPTGLGAIVQ